MNNNRRPLASYVSLDMLKLDAPRVVHRRVVLDLRNGAGELVLSGNATWVCDVIEKRRYYVPNLPAVRRDVVALAVRL